MAASISTLNILLAGSATGLIASMHSAGGAVGEFGSQAKEAFSLASEAFAVLGASLSVEGVLDWLKEAATRIATVSQKATELGISTESLTRLNFAAQEAGIGPEALDKAFTKMEVSIAKGIETGGKAEQAFSRIGLSSSKLAAQKPEEAFNTISEAIARIANPSERAKAAVDIFGKSGADLLPLLRQGSKGIDELEGHADALGITLKDVDAQKVLDANNATAQLGDVVEGVGNQIVVGLAPAITDIAHRVLDWAEKSDVAGKVVRGALTGVQYGAAAIYDVYLLLKSGAEIMASAGVEALALLVKGFDELAKAGAFVLNKIFHSHIDTSGIDEAANHLSDKAHELFNSGIADSNAVFSGEAASKIFKYFDDVTAKANASAAETVKAREGIADALIKEGGGKEKHNKLFDNIVGGIEKFWDKLVKDGESVADKILKAFVKGAEQGKIELSPKAVTAGSQEALSLIHEIQNRSKGLGDKDKIPEEHLREAKQTNVLLKTIASGLNKQTVASGVLGVLGF